MRVQLPLPGPEVKVVISPVFTEVLTFDEQHVRWNGHTVALVRHVNGEIRPEEYARLFAAAPDMARFIAATEWVDVPGDDKRCVSCLCFRDAGHGSGCRWLAVAKLAGLR